MKKSFSPASLCLRATCHKLEYAQQNGAGMRFTMHITRDNRKKIKKEASDIGKCAGLTCSRIALLVCLLFLFLPMRPTSIYLFTLAAIFPWILTNILAGRQADSQQIALPFCAKKYFYTPARYLAEKYSGNGLVICLATWQIVAGNSQNLQGVWKIAPALCLLVYCLCRLVSTIIFRRKIRRDFFELRMLQD